MPAAVYPIAIRAAAAAIEARSSPLFRSDVDRRAADVAHELGTVAETMSESDLRREY